MKKEITGTLFVLGGSLLAFKMWDEKKETKAEIVETRGGSLPYKLLGLAAATYGLYLIFKK